MICIAHRDSHLHHSLHIKPISETYPKHAYHIHTHTHAHTDTLTHVDIYKKQQQMLFQKAKKLYI